MAGLAAIIICGAVLRLLHLESAGLWHDEAFSWALVQYPAQDVIRLTAFDVHPPFYYLVLKAWVGLFGDSVAAMRALSSLLGIFCLPGIFLLSVEAYGQFPAKHSKQRRAVARNIGLLSAMLVAVSVFQVLHAREIRMYPLTAFLAVFSSWALLRALRNSQRTWGYWAVYATFSVALAYTHNFGLLTIFAQFAFAAGFVCWRSNKIVADLFRNRQLGQVLAVHLVIGLAYAPWIPVLFAQCNRVTAGFWTAPLTWSTLAASIDQLFGSGRNYPVAPLFVGATVWLGMIVVAGLLWRPQAADCFFAFMASTPCVLACAASYLMGRNVLVGRCLYISFPFFLVALAALIHRIPAASMRAAVAMVVVVNFAILNRYMLREAFFFPVSGMKVAGDSIAQEFQPGDVALTLSPGDQIAMKYYTRGRLPFQLLLRDGEVLEHYEASTVIPPDEIVFSGRLPRRSGQRVWVVGKSAAWSPRLLQRQWRLVQSDTFRDSSRIRENVYVGLWRRQTAAECRSIAP